MAEFRLGRLKFNWRSDWLVNTAYVIDDIVKYGANTYVAKKNHTSTSNENLFYQSDLSDNWTLHTEGISNKGDWQASTWYKINDIYKYGNTQYRVTTGHTSAATFEEGDTTLYVVEYLQSFNYEDTWNASTQYQDGDVVTYGGYTYVSKSVHTNKPPSYNLTDDWDIITTGFNVVGDWSASTDYKQGDVVLHGGYSYVAITTSVNTVPTTAANWSLVTKGVAWKGNWDSTVTYQLGDAVKRLSNSYIGVSTAGSLNEDPSTDSNSTYWSMLAEGAANNVMTTQGDMVYYTTGAARLPVGNNGQVLSVSKNGIPQWELNSVTHPVFYVTEEGSNQNDGSNISRSFHSVRHACGIATGPATIYVKAGTYAETLPIVVPEGVSIVGDNLRTSKIIAAEHYDHTFVSADADAITVTGGGTKTPVAGTTYDSTTGNLVLEIGSHTLTTSNTVQIGNDTLRFTCSLDNHNKVKSYPRELKDAASGSFLDITSTSSTTITVNVGAANLSTHQDLILANAPASVSYGSSIFNATGTKCAVILDSSYDDKTIQIRTLSGGAWTTSDDWENGGSDINITSATVRENKHSTMFQLSNSTMLKDILMENMTGFTPAGTVTSKAGTISGSILSSSNLFPDLVGTTVTGSGVQTGTKVIGFISSSQIEVDTQQSVSTTFTFTAQQYDPNNAHIKGVFVALNPESRIVKSPYVSNCSAKSVKGIGAIVDGGIHRQFVDGSATPSNKSIVFDSFTNIHDEGMAFWVTDGGTAEMVSCFTYYNHISYAATRGGRIRSLAGNSSWGKYGIVSSGFSPLEQTRDGEIEGLILQFDTDTMSGTGFQVGERIRGNSSTAWGTVNSVQGTTQNLIYYSVITEGDTVGVGTGFIPNETITAMSSGTTAQLINNPDANRGQAGRVLVLSGLGNTPTLEENGSIEFLTGSGNGGYNSDDITGADPFTFVINGVSQTGATGKGNVFIDRGQWTTTGAGHTGGTTTFTQYPVQSGSFTLLTPAQSGDTTFSTSTISGFNPGEYCLSPTNELCKITSFPTANSMTIQRAQDGAGSATSYNIGDTFTSIGQTNQIASAEINKDFTGIATAFRATLSVRFNDAIGDYVKIDNEFVKVTGRDTDDYGTTTLTLVEEKANKTFDEQEIKIRYIFSQARLTGHDFLQVGTGGTYTTNWPAAPNQDPVQSQEITEDFPGRVFYVSTDQQGNFRVGKYFRVNQATGAATLNANSFDLSGLTSIRLGSIGAQLGASINEFSTDGTLAQNSNEKVPTQAAVKTYVGTTNAAHLLMAQNHATLGLATERSQTQTDNSNTLSSAQSYTNGQINQLRSDVETEFRKEVQVSEFFVGQLG